MPAGVKSKGFSGTSRSFASVSFQIPRTGNVGYQL